MGGAWVEGRGLVVSDSISDDSSSQAGTELGLCPLVDSHLSSIPSPSSGPV